jgi:hypothetical protein
VHPDFATASGYIRRVVAGEVIHAVDWDGRPGVESIFREGGRRSRDAWAEFRGWTRSESTHSLREAGVKACQVLLHHYGPYDAKTSEALDAKRAVRRERIELLKKLDGDFPASVRCAARDYLAPLLFAPLQMPSFPTTTSISALAFGGGSLLRQAPGALKVDAQAAPSLAEAEDALRRHMELSPFTTTASNVDDYAREVLEKIKPIETRLDLLDVTEGLMRLPPIPGEREPADMDSLGYGHLICRHRAVIVALLLADAGYKVELVSGTVEQEGHQGGHLFVYSAEHGVLEASASGPEFWRNVESTIQEGATVILKVTDGAIYRCEHRTRL